MIAICITHQTAAFDCSDLPKIIYFFKFSKEALVEGLKYYQN